jgi:hypothetical protein
LSRKRKEVQQQQQQQQQKEQQASIQPFQQQLEEKKEQRTTNPLNSFIYALRSSEAQKQYSIRLKMFFNFLDLHGTLEEQATSYLHFVIN